MNVHLMTAVSTSMMLLPLWYERNPSLDDQTLMNLTLCIHNDNVLTWSSMPRSIWCRCCCCVSSEASVASVVACAVHGNLGEWRAQIVCLFANEKLFHTLICHYISLLLFSFHQSNLLLLFLTSRGVGCHRSSWLVVGVLRRAWIINAGGAHLGTPPIHTLARKQTDY